MDPLLILVLAIVIVVAIMIIVKTRTSPGRASQVAAARAQAQVEGQAQAMKQWQAAYALANPGQPIPAPPAMAISNYSDGTRTNTLAILTLVFGILGGFVAIIIGHISLNQIKNTGERGGGMAATGLFLGYLWVLVLVVIVVNALT